MGVYPGNVNNGFFGTNRGFCGTFVGLLVHFGRVLGIYRRVFWYKMGGFLVHLGGFLVGTTIHFVLCDNSHVVECFRLAKNHLFTILHKHPLGQWIKVFRMYLSVIQTKSVRVRWIKAHTGFLGNEIADTFAKWSSLAISPTSLILPPPPPKAASPPKACPSWAS